MPKKGRRLSAALAALMPLAFACAHRHPRAKPLEADIDAATLSFLLTRHSHPGDPQPIQNPPPAGLRLITERAWTATPAAMHRRLGARPRMEAAEGRGQEEFLRRPAAAETAALDRGDRPGEGEPQGRPAAARPDQIDALPTDGQPHYFSPAPFKKVESAATTPRPLDRARTSDQEAAAENLHDERARFAPAATAQLDDRVPETTVADPTALGSYHIQVAFDPDFRVPNFDKTYPFMADIDLEKDLANAGVKNGSYWIRYSLVDLLEFEHPYSRPQRLVLRALRR